MRPNLPKYISYSRSLLYFPKQKWTHHLLMLTNVVSLRMIFSRKCQFRTSHRNNWPWCTYVHMPEKKMILHWSLALSWCAIVSGRNQATNLLGYERSSWVRRDYRLPPLLVLESNVLWKVIHAFIASAMAGAPCHVTWHSMIGSLNFIGNQAIDPWQTQEQCPVVARCWKVVTLGWFHRFDSHSGRRKKLLPSVPQCFGQKKKLVFVFSSISSQNLSYLPWYCGPRFSIGDKIIKTQLIFAVCLKTSISTSLTL